MHRAYGTPWNKTKVEFISILIGNNVELNL